MVSPPPPPPPSLLLSLVVCSSDETLLPCVSASTLLDVFEGEGESDDGEEGEFFGGLLRVSDDFG